MSTVHSEPRTPEYFYKFALDYYITGRAAVLCRNDFVTGNLFHHAVEMLLKGQLSKTIPLGELKSPKKFGHDLQKLWTAFKTHFSSKNLAEFDAMIAELNKFENIRYPDEILAHGVCLSPSFGRNKPLINQDPSVRVPEYQMAVGDIDAFFAKLFPLCGLNPKTYLGHISSLGRQVLCEGNVEATNWLP
jgi:hypothetical protein